MTLTFKVSFRWDVLNITKRFKISKHAEVNSSKNCFLSRTNPHGTWIRNVSLYHLLIWGVLWHAKLQETEKKNLSAHAEDGNKLRHDARAKRLGQRREIEINSETMYVGNIKIEGDGQTERKTERERTACTRLVQSQWVKVNRVGGENFISAFFPVFWSQALSTSAKRKRHSRTPYKGVPVGKRRNFLFLHKRSSLLLSSFWERPRQCWAVEHRAAHKER